MASAGKWKELLGYGDLASLENMPPLVQMMVCHHPWAQHIPPEVGGAFKLSAFSDNELRPLRASDKMILPHLGWRYHRTTNTQ